MRDFDLFRTTLQTATAMQDCDGNDCDRYHRMYARIASAHCIVLAYSVRDLSVLDYLLKLLLLLLTKYWVTPNNPAAVSQD